VSEYGNLSNLESAADEAKAIAGYYQASAIIGAAATRRRVIGEMERSDVIHLATHAITDEWDPRRSKLLLARDPNAGGAESNNGVLQAKEIYNLDLSRVRLVVLSACQSAVEKYYGGEGMVGLSRPFIAQRIPLVVASLWPVESRSTARLMTSFHRYRKTGSGMPTVPALCLAQRDMIRSTNRDDRLPRNWASFVTIGGYASF
jgi:CHAT domain-containing protein